MATARAIIISSSSSTAVTARAPGYRCPRAQRSANRPAAPRPGRGGRLALPCGAVIPTHQRGLLHASAWNGDASPANRLRHLRTRSVPERISQGGEPEGEDDTSNPSPRRSVSLTFTCDKCEGRTTRLVSPDALKKGTVYVQCGECKSWHQLVDNLNLVFTGTDDEDGEGSSP